MRKVTVTLGIAVALLECSPPKRVVPENLTQTFYVTRPSADIRAAALEVFATERFRILSDEDEVVHAALRIIPLRYPEGDFYQGPVCFTVVVVKLRAVQDGTWVTVMAYRERQDRLDPDVPVPTAATLDEVHWCETVAEKLKKALSQFAPRAQLLRLRDRVIRRTLTNVQTWPFAAGSGRPDLT
jgi:hypothetical protein